MYFNLILYIIEDIDFWSHNYPCVIFQAFFILKQIIIEEKKRIQQDN